MTRILAILVLLGALAAGTILSDHPLPRADLTLIETVDPNTLDPQRMSYQQDFRLCYALYEGLLRWDTMSEDFHVVPALARSWEVSEDRRTYTFHLEPAARWSNGEPVTAHDLAYAWRRAIYPDTAVDYTALFLSIRGARSFFDWRSARLEAYAARPAGEKSRAEAIRLRDEAAARFAATVGIETPDDHTFRVTLERPLPYFLDLCAFGPFHPVHGATVERWTGVDARSGAIRQSQGWTKPPHLVTNGPYAVTRWRFKRDLRMSRNPYYWNPGLARSDTIEIRYIEDQNTAVLAFEAGAADWHADLEAPYLGDMLDQRRLGTRDTIRSFPTFGTYFWNFNCAPRLPDGRANPFHDARVRRAFTMAVDKEAIVRKARRSEEAVAFTIIPPGSIPGVKPVAGLAYDLARARAEFAEAGWLDHDRDGVPENARGEAFPVVELLATATGPHKAVALAMSRMWEEAFGVSTRIAIKESKVYKDALKRRDYLTARAGWFGDYLDPTTFLDISRSGDGNNDRGFSDPRYDALLAEADNEPDPGRRLEILARAERYLMEEALPMLPLWRYDQFYLSKPPLTPAGLANPGGLRGLSSHPRLVQYFFNLEVVKPAEAARAGAAVGAVAVGVGGAP